MGLDCRTVSCLECDSSYPPPSTGESISTGLAGASVAREHERRKQNRVHRVRSKHPRTAALRLALGRARAARGRVQGTGGLLGEEAVGAVLDERTAAGRALVLHDRRTPRAVEETSTTSQIAPTGVYVIDAKAWQGLGRGAHAAVGPAQAADRRPRLHVADRRARPPGRRRVRRAGRRPQRLALLGALCFTHAELPLLRTLRIRSHLLLHRKALAKRINRDGPLSVKAIERIARMLAASLAARLNSRPALRRHNRQTHLHSSATASTRIRTSPRTQERGQALTARGLHFPHGDARPEDQVGG